jgi:peptidoglycan/xylan/chitin deacetylase (PgdA/CDA1 family)
VREGRLKAAVFKALDWGGVNAALERAKSGTCILAYHGVTAAAKEDPITNARRLHVPAARFEEHLRLLARTGRVVALRDYEAALAGRGSVRRDAVVLTFDDGYRNLLTQAAPLLRRYDLPATAYVLTSMAGQRIWMDRVEAAIEGSPLQALPWRDGSLDLGTPTARAQAAARILDELAGASDRELAVRALVDALDAGVPKPDADRDLLTWDEVRTLAKEGFAVGSHGDVHEPLTRRDRPALDQALGESRRRLESELGPGAYPFCFAYGAWNGDARSAVEAAGFSSAVTTDAGLNEESADRFALRRFLIGADDDRARLRASVSGLRGFLMGRAPAPA